MKKTKEQRLLDAIFAPDFQSELLGVLTRQAVAAEKCERLYRQVLELQEQQLRLSEKSTQAAQDMVYIAKQNYADRLMAAVRTSTLEDEAP